MCPPQDLAGFTQCHFFAGVGVWSLALRRAGWPDSRPVWTGSCPCQPFSAAGKGNGFADERHLWPAWFHLIGQREPVVVFGEQVSSKDADIWVDLVQTDMEALGYAFGAVPFPSAGVGAPHIRDRLYWLADSNQKQRGRRADSEGLQPNGSSVKWDKSDRELESNSATHGVDNTNDAGLEGLRGGYQTEGGRFGEIRPVAPASESCRVEYATGDGREQWGTESGWGSVAAGCPPSGLADTLDSTGHGSQPRGIIRELPQGVGAMQTEHRPTGPVNGRWSDADWLFCRDGKWRPVEPGTFPLANGAPARVGRLRAYGNAINAEAVIRSYMECRP
jgi:DNA (cytosine-5)-methyltransferase 1